MTGFVFEINLKIYMESETLKYGSIGLLTFSVRSAGLSDGSTSSFLGAGLNCIYEKGKITHRAFKGTL